MTDIRAIEACEVPLLLPGARLFMAEGHAHGALNESHFVRVFGTAIKEKRGFALVAGVPFRGSIGGCFYEDVTTGDLCCMEYFWYVLHAERGSLGIRLLHEFERIVFEERRAARLFMMHHVADRSNGAEAIYQKRGYRLREQVYVKERSP